jgi:hypothetical protein
VMEGDFDRTVANAVRTEAGKLTVIELRAAGACGSTATTR